TARSGKQGKGKPLGTGVFQVTFGQNVTNCGYTGSLGASGATSPPAGLLSLQQRAGKPKGIFVRTSNGNAAAASLGFHVNVTCGTGGIWASIDGSGTVARGSAKITGASRVGTGTYEVRTAQIVSSCGYTATVGNPTFDSATPAAITTATRTGNP